MMCSLKKEALCNLCKISDNLSILTHLFRKIFPSINRKTFILKNFQEFEFTDMSDKELKEWAKDNHPTYRHKKDHEDTKAKLEAVLKELK